MTKTVTVGTVVRIKGVKTNMGGNRLAEGVVTTVHSNGSFDVEAGVRDQGLVTLAHLTRSSVIAVTEA